MTMNSSSFILSNCNIPFILHCINSKVACDVQLCAVVERTNSNRMVLIISSWCNSCYIVRSSLWHCCDVDDKSCPLKTMTLVGSAMGCWTSQRMLTTTTSTKKMSYHYSCTAETDWHSNNYCFDVAGDYDDDDGDDCWPICRWWAMWSSLLIFLVVLCAKNLASHNREDVTNRLTDCYVSYRPVTWVWLMSLKVVNLVRMNSFMGEK